MDDLLDDVTLPLFPLPNVVHFPHTNLKLQIYEPHYRRMVRDLLERDEEEPLLLGLVLLRPPAEGDDHDRPEVFPNGTAARLLEAEVLDDGSAGLLLHGEFRFSVEREVVGQPFRQAVVRPLAEPRLDERDAGLLAVRGGLLTLVRTLASELGSHFPVDFDKIEDLAHSRSFEQLVNRLAAELDLPPLRKLELLNASLPDRGLSLLSILRSRKQVVDQLRPYRHLAHRAAQN